MAKKSIATVGFILPGDEIEYLEPVSRQSLLEFDITLFRPHIPPYPAYSSYLGQPCYDDYYSARLNEQIAHWRTQLSSAVNSGRTAVIFLPPQIHFHVQTGQKEYSGTGKNARQTNIVDPKSNYSMIPLTFKTRTVAEGVKIDLADKTEELVQAWNHLKPLLKYCVYYEHDSKPFLKVKGTNNIVGSIVHTPAGGLLVMLPDFSFEWSDLWDEDEDEDNEDDGKWSAEAHQNADRLVKAALCLDALRAGGAKEPAPEWANESPYELSAEAASLSRISEIANVIESKQRELEDEQALLTEAREWKHLLYGKGLALENIVRRSLKLAGIEAIAFQEQDMEFDATFDVDGERFIAEIEGKDSKPISVEKISQLQRCIDEDFARDEVSEYAKGLLFGNAFRATPPDQRGGIFTEKVIIAAKRANIVLINTVDLFMIVRDYLASNDKDLLRATLMRMIRHPGGVFKLTTVETV